MYQSAASRTFARSLLPPNPMNLAHEHASTHECQQARALEREHQALHVQGLADKLDEGREGRRQVSAASARAVVARFGVGCPVADVDHYQTPRATPPRSMQLSNVLNRAALSPLYCRE
jgi:hypothetical protein